MTYIEAVLYQIKKFMLIVIVFMCSRVLSIMLGNTFTYDHIAWGSVAVFIITYIFIAPLTRKWFPLG